MGDAQHITKSSSNQLANNGLGGGPSKGDVLPSTPPAFFKRMSKQRYIDTKFWDDSYVIDLTPTEKLLFLYLLTSPLTNIAGIYEIALRRIVFDTGVRLEDVRNILEKFEKDKKIFYIQGWVVICNFPKYQKYDKSPKIKEGIDIVINSLPPKIKEKIHTLSIPYTYPLNYSNSNLNSNLNSKTEPSAAEAVLKEVFKDGFNIYQLLARLKKERGWAKDQNLPDEVIIGVCNQYFTGKDNIKKPWPWFVKVINAECEQWCAQQEIKKNEEFKRQDVPQSIKDIMKGMVQK